MLIDNWQKLIFKLWSCRVAIGGTVSQK